MPSSSNCSPTRLHPKSRSARLPLATALSLAALAASAQITPDAPVINFRLPMFNDAGDEVWNLRGNEGRYLDNRQVDLAGMRLEVFDKDQPGRVETRIVSPAATLLIEENEVRGDESITVTGDNFVLTGRNWLWEADEDRVVIDDDVKITFSQELSSLLVFQ